MQAGSPFVRKTEIRSFNCRLLFTQSKRPEEAHLLPTGNGGSVYCSHIKSVVGFAAVQADLFTAHKGSKATGCTKDVTLPDDYRLSIQRDSITFQSVYALRTECERYNSRFKATSQERLWVRNRKSAENLNTIAHISLLAIATAAFVTRHPKLARSRKRCSRCA